MTILTKSAGIEIDQQSRHRIPCDRRTELRKRDGYLRQGGENDSECPDIGPCDLPVSVRITNVADERFTTRLAFHDIAVEGNALVIRSLRTMRAGWFEGYRSDMDVEPLNQTPVDEGVEEWAW